MRVLPLLLLLALLPSAGAGTQDDAVAGPGTARLTIWDGQGQVVGDCAGPVFVTIKLLTADVPGVVPRLPGVPALVHPMYALQPLSLDGGTCPVQALASPRAEFGAQVEGSWAEGWRFSTSGAGDELALTTGPYGDGHGIAFRFLQSSLETGAPEVQVAGVFDDALAGA